MVNEQKLRAAIEVASGHPQDLLYFFERLKNPKVFTALKRWHIFDSPPGSRRDDDGRIVFVQWPPGKYLVNVAEAIPDEVAEVIRGFNTDNPLVVFDLVSAVLKMPAGLGKTLVNPMKAWFDADPDRLQYLFFDVIQHFVAGGEASAARRLARAVLALVAVDDAFESLGIKRRRAAAKIGDVQYPLMLDRLQRCIGNAEPAEFLKMLAHLLDEALGIEGEPASDYSSSWLPKVSKDAALAHGVKQHLAIEIYTTACEAVGAGAISVDEILSVLDAFRHDVFARIALAVVTSVGGLENAQGLLARTSTLLSYRQGSPERSDFLARFFAHFDDAARAAIIARLRAGITTEARAAALLRDRVEPNQRQAAVERYRARQMYEQLKPIGPDLVGKDKTHFNDLHVQFADEDRDAPKHGETWIGPTAPKSLEDLREMSTGQILSYLESWTPTGGWFTSSPEGLGRTLQPLIVDRRREFLDQWERVSALPPVYVRHIVEALRPHAAGEDFDYEAFLSLMEICRSDGAEFARKYAAFDEADEEPSWSPLRQYVAFTLTDMMRSKSMPYALRKRVFGLIESIVTDPDPTPEQDAQYVGETPRGQPWNLALNSARGAGMLALFEYLRWVNSAVKDADDFDLLSHAPELFSLLDRMLDPGVERTRAIRSTYGQNFVSVYAASRIWTKEAITRIFTDDEAGVAAWEAYLVFDRVFGETFAVLRPFYERHAGRIGDEPDVDRTDWYPTGSLGSHLLAPYLWGRIGLDDGPFAKFVRDAPASAVSYMMTAAGNAMYSAGWPPESMRRFESLFARLLELYADRPLEDRRKVLQVFGLWFISEHVDPQWALCMLGETLRATSGTVGMEWRVIERLGDLSAIYPLQTVRALELLVKTETPFRFMNQDGVTETLQHANSAGGESARTAVRVNDEFMKMGIRQYAALFA